MPAPYPVELKNAAVESWNRGDGSLEEVAERFGVSRRALGDWVRQHRRFGTLDPAPRAGGNFSQVDRERLLTLVSETRDATTDELTRLYNRGLPKGKRVHRSSILRALKREGFVFKKNVRGPQNKTGLTSAAAAPHSRGG